MLYLIATPIGNLDDLTFRAVQVMQSCDYLLCEDTRTSSILLQRYSIVKPLKSFHKFNEQARQEQLLQDLAQGKVIGLLSDAGTPGIADPGSALIRACRRQNIPCYALPGACSIIQAVSSFGWEPPFQFRGFLPKSPSDLKKALQNALDYSGYTIFLESPKRLCASLGVLEGLDPQCHVAVARELTKKFEETVEGALHVVRSHFQEKETVKGEITLLVQGRPPILSQSKQAMKAACLLQDTFGLSKKAASKAVAQLFTSSANEIYRHLLAREQK